MNVKDYQRLPISGSEYQELAMRTNDGNSSARLSAKMLSDMEIGGILNGVLGLTGEAGEFADVIKKWIFHEKVLDAEHAQKELGDVLWYVAMICESFGWDMGEIMWMNIDKLRARYPEGFDIQHANNRKENDV